MSADEAFKKWGFLPVFCLLIILLLAGNVFAVEIYIDASAGQKPISPYIYGKNNCLSDNPQRPLCDDDWQFLRDSGVKILRENGGNNSTKYNWLLKLSSHPDWYNNVYSHDWDYAAATLQKNLPDVQGMWAFQLIGKAASTNSHNFNDWAYNRSQWWEGVSNNWAGGGDPNLYLMDWPPEDTTAILDHWFDPNGCYFDPNGNCVNPDPNCLDPNCLDPNCLDPNCPDPNICRPDSNEPCLDPNAYWFDPDGRWLNPDQLFLNPNKILYWNMDNEPEIWSGTHDDVYPTQPSAEDFMQTYFEVAKRARALFPDIKLVGPVPCNEWQWYNWDNNRILYQGTYYTWLEYFIKRIGEEQQATDIRLLDVLDIHFYPGENNPEDILQLHRVWFDTTYDYPGANGVKRLGQWGWDNNITKEYIFERCRQWLEQYLGPDHGVTFGVSEMGINSDNPNVTALWYASTLGVFADEGLELFTPWSWKTGMWEVLHLFSRYNREIRVQSTSNYDEIVSAYASINADMNEMTIMLVNRSLSQTIDATVTLLNFDLPDDTYQTLLLHDLPSYETFVSHTDNALEVGQVTSDAGVMNLSLSPLSITAIFTSGQFDDSQSQTLPDEPDPGDTPQVEPR